MANLSPIALILIVVVCAVVALIVGYFLGSRFGGKKSVAMKEATEKHDSYKNDVREHFEQTSAIIVPAISVTTFSSRVSASISPAITSRRRLMRRRGTEKI